jgi:P-type Cu+ transporter
VSVKKQEILEIPILGMDCAECTQHVKSAISGLRGVTSVQVLLASEKAIVLIDPDHVDLTRIATAVKSAGYSVRAGEEVDSPKTNYGDISRHMFTVLGLVFGVVLFVVVFGEWLGLFAEVTTMVPFPVGLMIVLLAGLPVFKNVLQAAINKRITAHTLMSLGAIAALIVGQWATAAVVVFFMRIGDYIERFTTERARRAVKELDTLAPQKARVIRDGVEVEIELQDVNPGEIVVVRPGEMIPVDGEVISGQATVDQATITGESMPVEAGPGTQVYAATLATLGSLRVKAKHIGPESTFGRVIKMVEHAELHRGEIQRLADRFSSYYLPVVVSIAALTFILRQDALATAAVLIVACSCAFALATPIAILASVGAAARRGLLIKGGKYLESLAHVDVILIDKTGTLTLGTPQVTDVLVVNGEEDNLLSQNTILQLAASAERYSEHPLARAVREAAQLKGLTLSEIEDFEALPGVGVRTRINGNMVEVGSRRLLSEINSSSGLQQNITKNAIQESMQYGVDQETIKFRIYESVLPEIGKLESEGKTVFYVHLDGELVGLIASTDTLRSEAPLAIKKIRELGITQIELLTGDNRQTSASLAKKLGISYRAGLLPEDKIAIVKEYQAKGHTVAMIGDGVNDAPALAQAEIGIAVGAVGKGVAMEAAHIALLRDDWFLIPEVIQIARRTMRVVKGNIGFTSVFNLVGLSIAAMGYLPPILAAAMQAIPDLGILANSSRLLKR